MAMEDIEDLAGLGVDVAVPRHRNSVMPRVRRRKRNSAAAKEVRLCCALLLSCAVVIQRLVFVTPFPYVNFTYSINVTEDSSL